MIHLLLTWVEPACLETSFCLLTCFSYIFIRALHKTYNKKLYYYEEADFSVEKGNCFFTKGLWWAHFALRALGIVVWQVQGPCWICVFSAVQTQQHSLVLCCISVFVIFGIYFLSIFTGSWIKNRYWTSKRIVKEASIIKKITLMK